MCLGIVIYKILFHHPAYGIILTRTVELIRYIFTFIFYILMLLKAITP
jgi:hypothetical protein